MSVADLHDLTSRGGGQIGGNNNGIGGNGLGGGNLKPDMSSMYHHHMMQTGRQGHPHGSIHPQDMHDFLSGGGGGNDPMSAALGLSSGDGSGGNGNGSNGGPHHGNNGGSNQLHAPSALYSSHHHGAMNSKWKRFFLSAYFQSADTHSVAVECCKVVLNY